MDTSVSTSVLKGVTTYLSSLNAKSAVYSDDLKLLWTSGDEFFKTVDTGFIKDALPIKEETHLSLTVDKVRFAVSVTPLYRSKRLVSGYVCVMRDSTEIYAMANSSAVSDHARLFLQDIQEKANRIISLDKVLDGLIPENENKEKIQDILRDQCANSLRIFTAASASRAILPPAESSEDAPAVNCHVSALISGLCTEASQCLVKTKRKLIKDIDMRNYYAKVDYRVFAVAFMSILRSHLYISPLKSSIQVSSRFEDGNYIVTVSSELLPEDKMDPLQIARSMHDRELARKIVVSDCGGVLTFKEEKNTAVSEMTLPVIKKNRGASLNNANSEYLTGNYKPVRPFVDEITENEELAVAAEKGSKAASSQKNAQKRKKKQ